MKEKLNQYKKVISEVLIGSITVNVLLKVFNSLVFAFTGQFICLFFCDYIFRKQLLKSKRRMRWNVLLWVLKSVIILAMYLHKPLAIVLLSIMSIVSNRIMFHEDNDRTVLTVEELKEAYFVPAIVKAYQDVKCRVQYVLSA
ncbi:hypothetical protein [Bacillus sp. NPDC094106]|uniref:hypothetical protein n=1 Tax=Bacillus sp. NPDC094106 TaxID=3363949 RepID=UPI003822A8F8